LDTSAGGLPLLLVERTIGRPVQATASSGPGVVTRRSAPASNARPWRHRDTGELAFYRCYSPQLVPLRELVRVAGSRET
jgi:hypothetical protein